MRTFAFSLALAVCAVLAGARSFTAIAEWATDADEETPGQAGGKRAGALGVHVPPDLAAPCIRMNALLAA